MVGGRYLRVAEGGVQRLHHKAVRALVGEAQQELDNVVGREVCKETRGSELDRGVRTGPGGQNWTTVLLHLVNEVTANS